MFSKKLVIFSRNCLFSNEIWNWLFSNEFWKLMNFWKLMKKKLVNFSWNCLFSNEIWNCLFSNEFWKLMNFLKLMKKNGEFFMKLSIFEWNRWTIKLWLTNSHRDGPSTLWLVTADCRCLVYIKWSNSWSSHKMKHFSNN